MIGSSAAYETWTSSAAYRACSSVSAIVIATSFISHDVTFLASLFSFGVLLAFTAAQLAVIKLRIDEPDLARPYRAPFNVRIGRAEIPLPAIVGSSPRWRRQSRFFSPTVDYLLRSSPAEVLIVAFPQRVLDEEGGAA